MAVWRKTSFTVALCVIVAVLFACSAKEPAVTREQVFNQARENGRLANEGFSRSLRFVEGWLKHADPQTGLIPRNFDWQIYVESHKKGGQHIWNAKDAAADNYAFMVLTAWFTDRSLFEGRMLDMLKTETRLTSRLGRMPDTYAFTTQNFESAVPDLDRIIFGASEYVKDGLLPLTEWMGPSPWFDRMLGILDDMWAYAPVETPYGNIVSDNVEVNGEMLQTLSRIYWMTGQNKYLEWATRLGNYYLLGNHHPTRDMTRLQLRDHGCEIVSGLCEFYATISFAAPSRKAVYQKPVHEMLDRILKVGRNRHGLFYNLINPRSGRPIEANIADTWGYTFNGYYTVYLIDHTAAYREAVLKALSVLDKKYRNFRWEGDSFDGYADAIEGCLNLYNREPVPSAAKWLDSQIRVMWDRQREDGIIEGWHCDGNFARTTIMYCLWKTAGATIQPWRQDVMCGAVQTADGLYLSLQATEGWSGKLVFDVPRHETIMHLPLDWPRINQWPEWFVADKETSYVVTDVEAGADTVYSGQQLHEGFEITLTPGGERCFIVRPQAAGGRTT